MKMTNNSNPLIPTSIVDKNGKQTTVHKKLLPAGGAGITGLPAPAASAQTRPTIDWDRTSTEDAIRLVKDTAPTLSDPTHLWKNFEFYTGMMRSRHRVEGRAAFDKDNVLSSLRDAWLDMHGMVLDVDREKYYKLKGPDGYNAFIKARDTLLDAYSKPNSSKFKPSSSAPGDGSGPSLNPFDFLRERKIRKREEGIQRLHVEDAVLRAIPLSFGDDRGKEIAKSLNKAELAKAGEVLDILWDQKDEDAIKNLGRALLLDDKDHTMVHVMHAHKDYIKDNTGHLGLLTETARYLKKKGWDNQQADGSIPHLEDYVEAVRTDMLATMQMTGKNTINADSDSIAHYVGRAIDSYNRQVIRSI